MLQEAADFVFFPIYQMFIFSALSQLKSSCISTSSAALFIAEYLAKSVSQLLRNSLTANQCYQSLQRGNIPSVLRHRNDCKRALVVFFPNAVSARGFTPSFLSALLLFLVSTWTKLRAAQTAQERHLLDNNCCTTQRNFLLLPDFSRATLFRHLKCWNSLTLTSLSVILRILFILCASACTESAF